MAKVYIGRRGKSLQTFSIWTIICPAYILFGYNNAVAGGLLNLPAWIEIFPQINTLTTEGAVKSHNATLQGAVVGLYTLGCFFGALSCVFFGDRLGRIRTIMFAAGVCIIGATIQCSSFSLAQLIVGRIVLGMGLGAVTATAPNWQSECAGANHRGALVMLEGVFIGIGLAIAAWVNFGMSHTTGPVSWRFALAFPAFWALPVLIIIPFLPESPRWLLKHGRVAEARQTLSVLRDVDLDSEQIHFAINEMETSLAIAGETRFTDLFKMGPHRLFHRVCLAAICQMFQMVTGVNAIAFYIDNIFQVGLQLSTQNAAILSAAFYMMLALSAPIGVGTVDYFGRRKLMLFSSITSGTCLAVLAGAISVPITGSSSRTVDIVASIFLFGYNFGYAIGWLGLPFLFCAEIAPLSHRVPITAISTASTWLWAFVVALVTPVGVTNLAYRYYIIYAVFNLCMILPVVYFFFPETNGRTLEEVDEIFIKSKSIFDSVRIARELPSRQPLTMAEFGVDVGNKGRIGEAVQHIEGSD